MARHNLSYREAGQAVDSNSPYKSRYATKGGPICHGQFSIPKYANTATQCNVLRGDSFEYPGTGCWGYGRGFARKLYRRNIRHHKAQLMRQYQPHIVGVIGELNVARGGQSLVLKRSLKGESFACGVIPDSVMYSPLEFPNLGIPKLDKRFTGVELRAVLNRVQHTLVGPDNVSYAMCVQFKILNKTLMNLKEDDVNSVSIIESEHIWKPNLAGCIQYHQSLLNHQIQHYTQQLAKDTSANLKDLSSLPAPMSTSEQTILKTLQRQWKMQKERLADEFTSALNTFQATQRRAAQKEKDQMQRVRANSGLNDPFANLSKAGLGGRYTDQLIELQDSNTGSQQQDQMMDEMNLQLLEEQEQGIRQLESDISDVNQIFKELGAMVHEQGEVIDSIEAHVEKTEVFVSEGNTQLRQASTYQVRHPSFLLCMYNSSLIFIILCS
uniref:t-SNARE coiled-coil homology domain-containing protein n=1 Tax=Timema monikensis TaxID=170555 RepID=A0A7R9HMQ2_9NEOP|nr:unnamed protein product [Timema monikensis]